jgi:hypothetical protein
MEQAGLITGDTVDPFNGQPAVAFAGTIIWEGHEFLDAAREPAVWNQALGIAKKVGNTTWPIVHKVLDDDIAVQRITHQLWGTK